VAPTSSSGTHNVLVAVPVLGAGVLVTPLLPVVLMIMFKIFAEIFFSKKSPENFLAKFLTAAPTAQSS
jgi:hypothetical protein